MARKTFSRAVARRERTWARHYYLSPTFTPAAPLLTDLLSSYEATNSRIRGGTTVGNVKLSIGMRRDSGTADVIPAIIGGLVIASRQAELDDYDATALLSGVHSDWMWWRKLYLVGDGSAPGTIWHRSFDIEVAAMRKLQSENNTIRLFFGVPGADTYQVSVGSSVLLLLP